MEYSLVQHKGRCGGALLLQKACVKKNAMTAALLAVCHGESGTEKELLREFGAWFQNSALPYFAKHGRKAAEQADNIFDGLLAQEGTDELIGKMKKDGVSYILCAGDMALLSGENTYMLMDQFGRPVAVSGNSCAPGLVRVGTGLKMIVTDGRDDLSGDANVLGCLLEAGDENALSRAVREISLELPMSSFICLGSC